MGKNTGDLLEQTWEMICLQQEKQEIQKLVDFNKKTERFGLSLTLEEAQALMVSRRETLRRTGRVEFDGSILDSIIFYFCDSDYMIQEAYRETLEQLQDIFFSYKNESMDKLTDEELLKFMRTQFDKVCFGDLEYLRTTCLERFSRAVRNGSIFSAMRGCKDEYNPGYEEDIYNNLSEETRWERDLYAAKLEELE